MPIAKKILRFRQPDWQSQFLEQAEQFEHDYDNNDYSNYVEDVSVHDGGLISERVCCG